MDDEIVYDSYGRPCFPDDQMTADPDIGADDFGQDFSWFDDS